MNNTEPGSVACGNVTEREERKVQSQLKVDDRREEIGFPCCDVSVHLQFCCIARNGKWKQRSHMKKQLFRG